MKSSRPYPDEDIMDEESRREKAPRLSAPQDSPTPPQTKPPQKKPPAKTTSCETESQDGRQVLGDSKANEASAPNLQSDNTAANPEASPTDDSKTSRIATREAQLKVLLREEGDEFQAHIRSLEELEEFEEAMELIHVDKQRADLSAGFPQTQDGFVAHCRELFNAMKNLDNILDVVGAPGDTSRSSFTRSGDSVAVKFIKSKKPIEVILVAGKLMRAMRKAQRGRLSLPGRKFHEYGSFTLRFQAVVDVLMVSKLLVRSAFESEEWIDRIIINPDAELQRKKTNKTINDAKAAKQKFAERMKKSDPTIDFKNTTSPKSAETSPSAANPSPADQGEQQSSQGGDIQSPRIQTASDSSPASRRSKRVKTSQDQTGQAEELGPSSAYEGNISPRQQPLESQATDHGQQDLQTPQDGSLDYGFADSRLGEEAVDWPMEVPFQQMESAFASPGMSQAYAAPGGGYDTASNDAQSPYAQPGMLALDPNPFNVPGPIHDYDSGLYGPADPGFQGQTPGIRSGFRAIGPGEGHYQDGDEEDQENQGEDRDSVHCDG